MMKNTFSVAMKMVQWLSVFYTALGEDGYSVLSTHVKWLTTTYNSGYREILPSGLCRNLYSYAHSHMHINTYI